jgi:NAD(P)-dependent dehydrogenase (short-subunit alcohol dehydrogenase family)
MQPDPITADVDFGNGTRGPSAFSLAGKTALVTGGGGGIGRAICIGMAQAGADIVVLEHPRHPGAPDLQRYVKSLGRRFTWVSADLAETDALRDVATRIWDDADGVDILVNNAAISTLSWFCDQDLATWRQTMTVNLEAPFVLSQTMAELMIRTGREGRIVMISSKNGQAAEQGLVSYNTSKAGLEMLAKSLAVELGAWGITVNSVCPGMIETPMADDFDLDWTAFRKYYDEHIPSRIGFAQPTDVVGTVILLASAAGRYITGQSLVVDGGVLAQQLPRSQFMPPMRLAPVTGSGR